MTNLEKVNNPNIPEEDFKNSKFDFIYKLITFALLLTIFFVNLFIYDVLNSKISAIVARMDDQIKIIISSEQSIIELEKVVTEIKEEQQKRTKSVYSVETLKDRVDKLEQEVFSGSK